MSLGSPFIWTPEESHAAFFCRVCKAEFTRKQKNSWITHVVRCGEANHHELTDGREVLHAFNAPVDPEWQTYNEDLKSRGIDPDRQYDPVFKKSAKRLRES